MFNKKKKQAEQTSADAKLHDAIRAQLDAARAEKAELEQRIATLDEANANLDARLAALDHGVSTISEQLLELSTASDATKDHLGAIDGRVAAADNRLDEINARLVSSFAAPPSPTEAPPPPPAAATPVPPPPQPASGATATEQLSERITELRDQLDDLALTTSSIDERLTSVSMELANQLTELNSDIDDLSRRRDADAAGAAGGGSSDIDTAALEARIAERLDVAIDDVLDSTERLAAEQARYQIQFRADLAELAERLRRPGA